MFDLRFVSLGNDEVKAFGDLFSVFQFWCLQFFRSVRGCLRGRVKPTAECGLIDARFS
jgi:hypothetical protein